MKKLFLLATLMVGVSLWCGAQESAQQPDPAGDWTPFQVVFLPHFPSASWTSNVYGIKSGWPITDGIGCVNGLEASWLWSGTDVINGIQGSWVLCMNRTFNGLQAAFVTCVNREKGQGLQATLVYSQAGEFNGIQGGLVCLSDRFRGLQAALALNVNTDDVTGFQAAGVNVVNGKFTGVQCGLYSQVEECSGVQLGLVNVSGGGGLQFGLLNYIEDAWIPIFPILNFSF